MLLSSEDCVVDWPHGHLPPSAIPESCPLEWTEVIEVSIPPFFLKIIINTVKITYNKIAEVFRTIIVYFRSDTFAFKSVPVFRSKLLSFHKIKRSARITHREKRKTNTFSLCRSVCYWIWCRWDHVAFAEDTSPICDFHYHIGFSHIFDEPVQTLRSNYRGDITVLYCGNLACPYKNRLLHKLERFLGKREL